MDERGSPDTGDNKSATSRNTVTSSSRLELRSETTINEDESTGSAILSGETGMFSSMIMAEDTGDGAPPLSLPGVGKGSFESNFMPRRIRATCADVTFRTSQV